MTKVLDAAYPRWTIDALKQAGVVGVCRYVGHDYWSKAIKKSEYDGYIAAGIPVMLNYESTGRSWRNGFAQGESDGAAARAYARSLGHPDERPIVFSADEGVPFSMLEVCAEYMRGVNVGDGTGKPQGFYGTALAIDYLWDRGLISVAWQTNARGWEGNHPDSAHASLFQRTSHSFPQLPSSSYDENDLGPLADFGQHPAPTGTTAAAEPIVHAKPQEDVTVILQPHRKKVKNAPGAPCAVLDTASKSVLLYNGARLKGDTFVPQWNLRFWKVVDADGKPVPDARGVVGIREVKGGLVVVDSTGKFYFAEWA